VHCGAGDDVVIVDAFEDGMFDCETVERPPA
jgi:hypothetical protein